jgi:non-specific serine/threonine protein kinase
VGALAALGQGDHQRTRALCEEGLQTARQLKMMHLIAAYLHVAASLAGSQGKPVRSARLWGAAESLRETIGTILSSFERHLYGPYMDAARTRLDEAAWEAAWAEGRAISFEEAIEYAISEEEPSSLTDLVPQQLPASVPTDRLLTHREHEVAVLVARGLTNRQVAAELGISEHTAITHVRNILKKLGFHSRARISDWVMEQRPLP